MLVAESGYIKVEDPMSNMEFPIFTYECKHCKKHFKSEQVTEFAIAQLIIT